MSTNDEYIEVVKMKNPVLLSEKGIEEFNSVIENAKIKLQKVCEEALGSIYGNIHRHIETDTWFNYRSDIRQELAYDSGILEQENYWARNVRMQILKEHKEELAMLINKDLLEKIGELEDQLKQLYKMREY